MPAEHSKTKTQTARKNSDRPPSSNSNEPTSLTPLNQLKTNIAITPGIIKNAEDARAHLIAKQWALPSQEITSSHLSNVLFEVVATQSSRTTTSRIPDAISNIIKAVAFLLEDVTVATYADKIAQQISESLPPPTSTTSDNTAQKINEMLATLTDTLTKQSSNLQANNDILEKIHSSQTNKASSTPAQPEDHLQPFPTYREALINGRPIVSQPEDIREKKILNKLNIGDCQTLIEVKAESSDALKSIFPTVENVTHKIKTEINKWFDTYDEDSPPPPPKSSVRSVTQYRNNKILIETTTKESTVWLKQNGNHFLTTMFGHPVLILGRLFPVIARFMPVLFHTNEESIRELETSANLDANSISQVRWIKNPINRRPTQQFANLKILCTSAEAANTLIMEDGRIKHLGSQLKIHKDIKAPSTCNRCQKYGHIFANCSDTLPTCAYCAEQHSSASCTSTVTKCTPCGSTDHRTNSPRCPERYAREEALMTKNPEALTPYYATHEHWTWGINPQEPTVIPETAFDPSKSSNPGPAPTYQRSRRNRTHTKGRKGQQDTLTSMFNRPNTTKPCTTNSPDGAKNPSNPNLTKPQEEQGNSSTDTQPHSNPPTSQKTQPPSDNPQ